MTSAGPVRGLDIGCGANLIYPLLGAAMNGWAFVAADVTPVAVEWARRNAAANPHLAPLLEVRHVGRGGQRTQSQHAHPNPESGPRSQPSEHWTSGQEKAHVSDTSGTIITPAVHPGESFAFTICNPPFFSSSAEAGLNPNTAHGGACRAPGLVIAVHDVHHHIPSKS